MAKRRLFIMTNFTSSAALCSVTGQIMCFFLAREEATGEGGRGGGVCSFRRIEQNPKVTSYS